MVIGGPAHTVEIAEDLGDPTEIAEDLVDVDGEGAGGSADEVDGSGEYELEWS